MDIKELKTYIYENQYIEQILEDIQCHHIKYHSSGNYWSCANATGNNQSAITIKNCEQLWVTNYTRQMVNSNRATDIIDLVSYTLSIDFVHALRTICNKIGISYYYDFSEDIPESFRILDMINSMSTDYQDDSEKPLLPISENVLTYYRPYVNDMFYKDNISYGTQKEFEVGYDEQLNRITIPIRSDIGDLCGVKGRLFKYSLDENEQKYIYIEKCARSKILYGLYKTMNGIKNSGIVYVMESEKAVMQLWSYGYYNGVATGGKKVSNTQIEMLFRLGVEIVFAFDKDVQMEELEDLANRFPNGTPLYYIFDKYNLLNEKESPSDNPIKWESLIKNNKYKIR